MKIFFGFIKSRCSTIIIWAVFSAVFWAVFSLYGLPAKAVLYAAAICAFIGIIYAAADYLKYRRKILRLKAALGNILYDISCLPLPTTLCDSAYTDIIDLLYKEKKYTETETSHKLADMTDYYTMWAHQIKTPIAAMRLLLQSEDIPESRELSDELRRIEQYVEMVMCYLRLESDSTDYTFKRYDLDDMLKQAVKKYSSQFIRKKIRLDYEPLNVSVLTDEKWLLFVLEQVLSNALKYTPEGGSIALTLEKPCTLCISDTGIGVAPEDLPRIFEKGFTGCNGRYDKKASGIGLYLCRRICGSLGHTIEAFSDGKGTTIKIGLEEKKVEIE